MSKDVMFFGLDMALLQEQRKKDPPKRLPWHRSPAKALLETDIDNDVHLQILPNGKKIKPEAIYKSRSEYQEHELKVFRNHIYQEVKRREKLKSNVRFAKKKLRVVRPVIATNQAIDLIERGEIVDMEEERKRLTKKLESERLDNQAEPPETAPPETDNSTTISTTSGTSKTSTMLAKKREAASKKKKKATL
ncbi:unknown protein [Seminavis robusta]|uniref:Uncharacterized protein n=1 Tax=Seminavis robusta TaxID=568900 RepID=A0A9N8HYF7_9STRA|nr:unknown protein [Seminavis robusta]|eukprot:Sro1987_g309530.1 n/a (192) ;mRNA; r:3351-3926